MSLLLVRPAEALAPGVLTKALRVERPVVVHLWDRKPTELESFAIDDVSNAARESGAAALLCPPALVKVFAEEQQRHQGDFPGPLPVVCDCPLIDMTDDDAALQVARGAKELGACALGLIYYAKDWPDAATLEVALQRATVAAERAGLDSLLLAEFGKGGCEGAGGAGALASRVGASAALAKECGKEDGASLLGSWDGSTEELQRLRDAGFKGVVLKNACRGEVGRGARTSSPSIAARMVAMQVKAALSKRNLEIWGGAGGVAEPKESSMSDYFDRR